MSEVKPCRCEYCEYRDMKHHNFPCNGCLTITNDGVADLFHPRTKSTIADSGNRREFPTGAVRDMAEGKGRCDLIPLDVAAVVMQDLIISEIASFVQTGKVLYLYNAINRFEEKICMEIPSLILELAQHFEAGAKKYGENNWKKGLPIHCYIDSGVRHYLKWLRGDDDEPHHRAFVWNIVCCIWTCVHKPELNEYGSKTKDEPNTGEWGEIKASKEVDDALYAVDSAKAAPKTYEQDFLEKFPNTSREPDGLFEVCRNDIYGISANMCPNDCVKCWNEVMPNENT